MMLDRCPAKGRKPDIKPIASDRDSDDQLPGWLNIKQDLFSSARNFSVFRCLLPQLTEDPFPDHFVGDDGNGCFSDVERMSNIDTGNRAVIAQLAQNLHSVLPFQIQFADP